MLLYSGSSFLAVKPQRTPQDSEYCLQVDNTDNTDLGFDPLEGLGDQTLNFNITDEEGVVFMDADEMARKIQVLEHGRIDKSVRQEIQHWLISARKVQNMKKEAEEAKIKKEEEAKEEEKKDHVGIIKELGLKHSKSWAAYGMLYFDGYAFANGTADYIFEDEIDENGMKKVHLPS